LPKNFDPDDGRYDDDNDAFDEEVADDADFWSDDDEGDGDPDGTSEPQTPAPEPPKIPEPDYPPDYIVKTPRDDWSGLDNPDDLFELQLWASEMYPAEGFLPVYMRWSRGATDAPDPIHFVTGLSLIAAAVGTGWKVRYSGVHAPNIYTLIIADSASRKSTAMGRGVRLLPDETYMQAKVASSLAFIELLDERPEVLWYQDEADILISTLRDEGANTGLAPLMVKAYDNEPLEYTSKAQGFLSITGACPTLLAGSAIEWLIERGLSPEFLRGGLFARFWVVPAKRNRQLLVPPSPDKKTSEAMSKWLEDLAESGPFEVRLTDGSGPDGDDALDLLAAYQEGRGSAPSPQLSSIWNRVATHIAKLALLYHISLYRSGTAPIREDCVEWACNFLHNYVLPGHRWVMDRLERTNDPVQDAEMRILMALENAGEQGRKLSALYGGFGARFKVKDALSNLYGRERLSFWSIQKGDRAITYVVLGTEAPLKPYEDAPVPKATIPAFVTKIQAEEGLDDEPDDLGDDW